MQIISLKCLRCNCSKTKWLAFFMVSNRKSIACLALSMFINLSTSSSHDTILYYCITTLLWEIFKSFWLKAAAHLAFNPIWHGRGYFYPLDLFGSDFFSWIFFKNFQTFLEVKIDINWVILTFCQVHWVFKKMTLGGAKDEHFSCFPTSCQTGLRNRFLACTIHQACHTC